MTQLESSQHLVVRPQQGSNGTSVARQGFGEQSMERRDTAATAIAERARAEIQSRYVMAMQRPRTIDAVRVRVLEHCKRPRFAEKARYAKPVGGQRIEGPSIRFVEAALVEYGNVLPECSIVYEDDERVTIRVSVTDLERNITHADEATILKRMERRKLRDGQRAIGSRTNSRGEITYLVEASDDDLANLKAARQSKLLRNLGLRILPADIVEEAMDLCVATLERGDAQDPDAARKRLVDSFYGIGVSPDDLVAYLGHDLGKVVPAELTELRAIFAAIRDGETTWQATLDAKQPPPPQAADPQKTPQRGTAAAKERLKRKAEAELPAQPAATPAPPPASDDEYALALRGIRDRLERIGLNPSDLAPLRKLIDALPPGEDADELHRLWQIADRTLDDVPDFTP